MKRVKGKTEQKLTRCYSNGNCQRPRGFQRLIKQKNKCSVSCCVLLFAVNGGDSLNGDD